MMVAIPTFGLNSKKIGRIIDMFVTIGCIPDMGVRGFHTLRDDWYEILVNVMDHQYFGLHYFETIILDDLSYLGEDCRVLEVCELEGLIDELREYFSANPDCRYTALHAGIGGR